ERVLAVGGPARVRVQIAAQPAELDELRQLVRARRRELTGVLAQLRRNELVAEELVQLRLVLGVEDLAALHRRDAVLGDRQAAPDGTLAQRDIVLLRAREVLEQVAVRLRRDDAQVEAQAVVRDDRRLRVALRGDLGDPAQL